jgi:hypothetical protein
MELIIQRVILNHLQMNSQDSNSEYNNSVLRLYYRFLRKIGLFRELYGERGKFIPRLGEKPIGLNAYPISNFSLTYTCKLMTGKTYFKLCFDAGDRENEKIRHKLLQYSQLWRLFILDNFDKVKFTDATHKQYVYTFILSELSKNGTRGSKEVEEGFRKYDLKIKYT